MPETPTTSEPDEEIRTDLPHTARIWNHWLGGKDNYVVDQEVGEEIRRLHPGTFAGFLEGLRLLEPGVVSCNRWYPDPVPGGEPAGEVALFDGVARKP